ncbi:ubiquitin-protein ligase (E3) [Marasmius sp. AFHP31]|nr:ubiquitin-protein ligase (E3) [Marasmius sp. AFHP31]
MTLTSPHTSPNPSQQRQKIRLASPGSSHSYFYACEESNQTDFNKPSPPQNRLPLPVLTQLSVTIAAPLAGLSIDGIGGVAEELCLENRVYLLSNLLAFVTPRVAKLPKTAVEVYIHLLADLLGNILAEAFDLDARDDGGKQEKSEYASSMPSTRKGKRQGQLA